MSRGSGSLHRHQHQADEVHRNARGLEDAELRPRRGDEGDGRLYDPDSCAVTAAAQISPAVDFADLDGNLLIANDRFEGMTVVDGKITLPDRPGLGLKLL